MFKEIIDFWFEEIEPASWWRKDPDFDELIRNRFLPIYQRACVCELFSWRQSPKGRLAEIIILDQFPRNMFRDTALAFSSDALALALSQEAVSLKVDVELSSSEKSFLYMPYMHSESLAVHHEAIKLFAQCGNESNLKSELRHKEIIEKFGRYPHRNETLGRKSRSEEIEFLTQPGSRF